MSAVAEADSIVEVEMSSQPLPDLHGILNGKFVVGSNETLLIYKTAAGELRLISMDVLNEICSTKAKSSKARDAEFYAASTRWAVISPDQ